MINVSVYRVSIHNVNDFNITRYTKERNNIDSVGLTLDTKDGYADIYTNDLTVQTPFGVMHTEDVLYELGRVLIEGKCFIFEDEINSLRNEIERLKEQIRISEETFSFIRR